MMKNYIGIAMIAMVFIVMGKDSLFKNAQEIETKSEGVNINIHHSGSIYEGR